jgi:hypothetical protein
MIHLQIIPDRRLENAQVEDLLRALTGMYQLPISRWNGRGFNEADRAAWEIVLEHKKVSFYLTVPEHWRQVMEKQIAVIWPRATLKEAPDQLAALHPTTISKLELKNHFMFSLKADRRTLGALPSILETTRLLGEGERAVMQVLLDPAPPDWWQSAVAAYEEFRAGRMPQRIRIDWKAVGMVGARVLAGTMLEAVSTVNELITGEPLANQIDGPDKALALRERPMGYTISEKLRGDAFDTTIRLAIEAGAGESIARSLWYACRSLDADNSFVLTPGRAKEWELALARRPGWKINHDYLSTREASMLMMLPTGPLQQEFGLESVAYRETRLPKIMLEGGLQIGNVVYHGDKQPVYLPVKNFDELCLPHIVIGGMGVGKDVFGANMAVEAVKAGYGAVIIDPVGKNPNQRTIGDWAEEALPPDKVMRITFGKAPICIDWREALHATNGRNRLANSLISFVEAATDEAGAQTVRFMRSAAKAVPNGRLSEVVALLTDDIYRAGLLPHMRPQEKLTWTEFSGLSEARRLQVAMPVLNRLDVIEGDDYLSECMDAAQGVDFVELLDVPRVLILDVPKDILGPEAVDILGSLLVTKLDLAMVLRNSRHPVFIVQNEPHQYMRSSRMWRSSAVESRKWRFSYCWMFHSWEQIPRGLGEIIKSALPHYHLYTSSQDTYKALASEIKPFEPEEAMATPRHWCINVIRAGGVTVTPFLTKMMAPPRMETENVTPET